ncbi:HAD family hydrolase [Nocardioides sp. Kera G14]|uniref:HAD family hydrolase n=1 Tax=Nocardioides sp. Kera G14 TaxID=2884264 RepID=UPI001D10A4D5|nr:beta-phosphoglucomutase family hydrolase [Nocardioides sp. Kera G14]UDY22729.1 beta-phosphoglucomutase family hydrolase [Nocardioides sp. Kera G14]
MAAVDWPAYKAVLFDLDGVVTPTALVHMQAWAEMFNDYLASRPASEEQRPFTDADYHAYVDGKPRYDGVRSFLESRGIHLDGDEVVRLGDLKNDRVNEVLERDGVEAYPGSVALIDHLDALGIKQAVVSSSANAPAVLRAAGLYDRFETIVDGHVARDLALPGKPAPDTFLHAAEVLGATAAESVVLEDAVSGVMAGKAGHFGLTIGVDRGAGSALTDAGADVLVKDLAELVPDGAAGGAQ